MFNYVDCALKVRQTKRKRLLLLECMRVSLKDKAIDGNRLRFNSFIHSDRSLLGSDSSSTGRRKTLAACS